MAVEAPGRLKMAFGGDDLVDDAIVCGPKTSQRLTARGVEALSLCVGSCEMLPILVDMSAPEGGVVVLQGGLVALSVRIKTKGTKSND
jgi:hypothetical protein